MEDTTTDQIQQTDSSETKKRKLTEEELLQKKQERKEKEKQKRKEFWILKRQRVKQNRKKRKLEAKEAAEKKETTGEKEEVEETETATEKSEESGKKEKSIKRLTKQEKDPYNRKELWKQKDISEIEFTLPHVAIDLSFQDQPEKELGSVANQVLHAYGLHKRFKNPLYFHITSFYGVPFDYISKNNGYQSWKIFYHKEHFSEVFDKNKIIYLSAESPNVLTQLDKEKVYIIGGISDNANSMKGATFNTANKLGIQTARLPLEESGITLRRTVLNVNHVFEILSNVANGMTFKEALEYSVPQRLHVDVEKDRKKKEKRLAVEEYKKKKKMEREEQNKSKEEGETKQEETSSENKME